MGEAIADGPLIAVVDDQRDVRTTLSRGLAALGFRCHPLASGQDLLDALEYLSPDCILLDLRMPGMDGIEALQAIPGKHRGIPVLFFTSHGDIPLAVQAMQLGAADFIEKPSTLEQIATKIRSALTAANKSEASAYSSKQARALVAKLTVREREIMALACEGLLSKEIASRLDLSVRTVESHRRHAMQKLGEARLVNIVKLFQAAGAV
jgi:two-component system response regulator DctR